MKILTYVYRRFIATSYNWFWSLSILLIYSYDIIVHLLTMIADVSWKCARVDSILTIIEKKKKLSCRHI